ncbi:NEW3 domain-containing protein [soil metagenome]
MRSSNALLLSSAFVCALSFAALANAQEAATTPPPPATLTGLWLTTDFPSVTERAGDDIKLDLTLQNRNQPPKRVELGVTGLPNGWTWEIDGGGKPVSAAIVAPDQSQRLSLKIVPPKDARKGTYNFTVSGKTDADALSLPVTLVLSEAQPAKVTVEPKLPALRGSPKSAFDFDIDVKNDALTDATFNLLAQAPAGFQVVFKEQYGAQELTSIPIKAGETRSLKASVSLPQNVAAGQYQVRVGAASPTTSGATPLLLDVTGQPSIAVGGPDGRLSGDATAGLPRTFKFSAKNDGTAPARTVKFDASAPQGWKVEFDPAGADTIAPGDTLPVSVTMTPSDKAIAGDYVVSVRANGDGASDSQSFRVTVLTSTMWGIAGLGIIGAAVVVLAFAVTRYGRR